MSLTAKEAVVLFQHPIIITRDISVPSNQGATYSLFNAFLNMLFFLKLNKMQITILAPSLIYIWAVSTNGDLSSPFSCSFVWTVAQGDPNYRHPMNMFRRTSSSTSTRASQLPRCVIAPESDSPWQSDPHHTILWNTPQSLKASWHYYWFEQCLTGSTGSSCITLLKHDTSDLNLNQQSFSHISIRSSLQHYYVWSNASRFFVFPINLNALNHFICNILCIHIGQLVIAMPSSNFCPGIIELKAKIL